MKIEEWRQLRKQHGQKSAPPLGVMPRRIAAERGLLGTPERLDAVRAAVERYANEAIDVPEDWLAELAESDS